MVASAPFEPRVVCTRCRRPAVVCYCAHLTTLETTTRVVLLQHPRERDMPIGTAHMASLCLPRAELHVGVHWRGSREVMAAIADPARPAALLYPGEGATDVLQHPPASPVTLVVVDGTWAQTKKVVRENPELAALPRFAFTPPRPSEYRIRREPQEAYVSTIEALMHVLGALEGDPARFTALLTPFRAMIDAQLTYVNAGLGRRLRVPKPRKPRRFPALLRARAQDVVCVVAEANAWPIAEGAAHGGGGAAFPDELVHWAACRPSTGEAFEAILAPRHPPSPRTPEHLRLTLQQLEAGESVASFRARWQAFLRDGDIAVAWGPFARGMLASVDGAWPDDVIDLRRVMRDLERGSVGTAEAVCARFGLSAAAGGLAPLGAGRGGVRLAQLVAVVRYLSSGAFAGDVT